MDPIRRAERAKVLLDDELMVAARSQMREALTHAMWRRHALAEPEQAKLDAYVRHFEDFWAYFGRVLADGKMAEADLKEKSRLRKFVERTKAI